MADNNTTGTVPAEVTRQQHEAVVPAAINMSDSWKDKTESISTDGKDYEALTEDEGQTENDIQFEHEPDENDQMEDDALSFISYSLESLIDDEEAVQKFKQKITALGTELHVDFEDISYLRERDETRAFSLTLRNPPEGAPWPDGTRAVLRLNGWWSLHDETSHGSHSGDDDKSSDELAVSEASDHTEEVDVPNSNSLDHETVPSSQEVRVRDDEAGDTHEPQSPVSTTSTPSVSSNISGNTLLNDYYDSDSDSHHHDDNNNNNQWKRLDEVLLLNLLEGHGVPAPKTLAFDVGFQNALNRPYSIQTYLPGEQVSKVHREKKEMSLEDRLWLAGEAAELRARLDAIHFQGSGRLQAPVDADMTAGRLPLRMSATTDINEQLDIFPFLIEPYNPDLDSASALERHGTVGSLYYSLYDAMFRAVDDLLAKALVLLQGNLEPSFRVYAAIKDMLRDMDHLGWFSESDRSYSTSVLSHDFIDDTQILVERTGDPSKPWRLTGIVGFDEAQAIPSVLTRKPWNFLWDIHDASEMLPEETRFSWNGNVDELPTELPYLNADDLKVKRRYEDVLIEKLYTPQYGDKAREKYFDDTYGRGRWLRRLFIFVREGVPFRDSEHRFNKLLRDWNHFKKSQGIQPRALNLWEGLPDYIHAKQIPLPQRVEPPAPPSSLRHVYFFIDPPPSSPRGEAAATQMPDDSSEPNPSSTLNPVRE